MNQKIIQMGNSTTKKGQRATLSSVTPEFLAMLDKVNKKYGVALKKLAGM